MSSHNPTPAHAHSSDENESVSVSSNTGAELAALLSEEACKSLTATSRLLLIKSTKRFLQDPQYREIVRQDLEPGPNRRPFGVFRLMDLPTELRIMIAEYALSYDKGLEWIWKEEQDGSRTGRLRVADKSMNPDGRYFPQDYAINPLCLSRQLRTETARLCFKVNEITFDGGLGDDGNKDDWNDGAGFQSAVDDLTLFLSRTTNANLRVCSIKLEALGINATDMERLARLLQGKRRLKLQVVDYYGILGDPNHFSAQNFLYWGIRIRCFLNHLRTAGIQRSWRVFPAKVSPKRLDVLRTNMSHVDYQVALDWMHNGI